MKEIVYHGLGYVGLTGAVHFARAGINVIGYDPDQSVVDAVNAGRPKAGEFLEYIAGLQTRPNTVQALINAGLLRATTNFDEIIDKPIHIIAVPTEKNGEPYDEIVLATLDRLHDVGVEGATVLIESTLQPGTIDRWLARLAERSGIALGRASKYGLVDLHVAVCPRRDWFADPKRNLDNLPRVIGGVKPCCTTRASSILSFVTDAGLHLHTDYRTAEVTKALENALFHLPIMLCHQLACAMPHVNIAEAVRLACTHWRFESFGGLYLGFGPGGRCVPLGPRYLLSAWGQRAGSLGGPDGPRILRSAMTAEITLHEAIARAARRHLGRGEYAGAVVLGIAYRLGFKDAGLSPGLSVLSELKAHEFVAFSHDPLWTKEEMAAFNNGVHDPYYDDLPALVAHPDVVLLATPHTEYLDLPPKVEWRSGQVVIDGQGAWKRYRELFADKGVKYVVVGEPGWTG